MYEISKLINEVISQSKERKRELVLKLGYRNLNKGYRRLDTLLETGICPDSLRDKLPEALNLDKELVDQAFKITSEQKAREEELARKRKEEYERAHFKPHLWIDHENNYPEGANFWFIVFTGITRFKVLNLPESIAELDWDTQLTVVRERIQEHQKYTNGEDSIFGRVTGYIYCQTYDDSFLFSIDGKLVRRQTEKLDKPEPYIEVGNKRVNTRVLNNS